MGLEFGQRSVSRRHAVHAIGTGVMMGLAGCLGSSAGSAPEPVDLSGQKTDYKGGMVIGDHGGPNGQIFYADAQPEPKQGPAEDSKETAHLAWFHTLAHGLFPYHFDMVDDGAEATAIYVTDYSRVDWEIPEGTERKKMPAPSAAMNPRRLMTVYTPSISKNITYRTMLILSKPVALLNSASESVTTVLTDSK